MYKKKQMKKLAGKVTIDNISPANIICNIHATESMNAVKIIFYGQLVLEESFKRFFDEFQSNINDILCSFVTKLTQYHFSDPKRELHIGVHETCDLKSTSLCEDKNSFEYKISANEINSLTTFLKCFECTPLTVRKFWGHICIDFVTDILTKIFGFNLFPNNYELNFEDSKYSKTFVVLLNWKALFMMDIFSKR